MLFSMADMQYPVLSVITVGLSSSDIITTLSPLTDTLSDPRVEFVVVTPLPNVASVSSCISAVFVSDQGEGVYQAMNLGISAARGDYLWFLNSGDECLLNRSGFSSLLSTLSSQRLKAAQSSLLLYGFQPPGAYKPWLSSLTIVFLRLLAMLSIMPVSHQNILFLRAYHKPFSTRYKYSCDFEALIDFMLVSECDISFASRKPIAKLSAGGISDSNRLGVFRERYNILLKISNKHVAPLFAIGFLVRVFRELVSSKIKLFVGWR